jgi:hypothetical protein
MKEVRRENLRALLEGPRFKGDRAAFCAAAGISKGRLSQLLDKNKSFGDVAAQNLCEVLGLPADYLNLPIHEGEPVHHEDVLEPPPLHLSVKGLSVHAIGLAKLFDEVPTSNLLHWNQTYQKVLQILIEAAQPKPAQGQFVTVEKLRESHPSLPTEKQRH